MNIRDIVKWWKLPTAIGMVMLVVWGWWWAHPATTVAKQGILEWFQKPAAVRYVGQFDRTYITWISQNGRIQIRYQDHRTGSWSPVAVVDDLYPDYQNSSQDDHNAPAVLILPSGELLVFYSVHDRAGSAFVKRSRAPEDISAWDERQTIIPSPTEEYDYPQPKLMPDGRIVLFLRRGIWKDAQEIITTSADQGRTWTAPRTVIDFGSGVGIYALAYVQGDAIHLAWSERRDGAQPTNVYYTRSDDGGNSWTTYKSGSNEETIKRDTAEIVYAGGEPAFIWDIVADNHQRLALVFAAGDDPNHRYIYAYPESGAWVTEKITGSRLLYGAEHFYSGGVVIDPKDLRRVVLSNASAYLWLETWYRTDNGDWRKESNVTTWSMEDNFRPQFVSGSPDREIIWCRGAYTGLRNKQWDGFKFVRVMAATLGQTKQ